MGGMADGSAPEDLWHLTIDDLLSSAPEPKPIGGAGPYVINLSASTAPISLPPPGLLGFDQLNVYQVQQREHGQQRFRLRLGPIDSELEADAILGIVREHYPRALTAAADEDDLRAIAHAAARNERKPSRGPAPSAPDRSAGIEAPSIVPTAPRAADSPAKAAPAKPEESRSGPVPPKVTAPARPVRVDDPVSAKELAEMFLAAPESAATVVPKQASAAAPNAPLKASPPPVIAPTADEKAKPAPATAVANAKAMTPPPAPAPAEKATLAPSQPVSPAVEKLTVAPPPPPAAPVEKLSVSPPPLAAAPVEQAKAAPSPSAPVPVEKAKPAPTPLATAAIELPKFAGTAPPAAPVATTRSTSTVPVLGVEDVATPRAAKRRAPALDAAPLSRAGSTVAPPTLRSEPLVVPREQDELSIEPIDAWALVDVPSPAGPVMPPPLPSVSSPAVVVPVATGKTPAVPAVPVRVALADFFAREAPAFLASDWAPIARPVVDAPAAAPTAKAVAPPSAGAEPATPLSLAPSPPRAPLVDPTLHLSPALRPREARPEVSTPAQTRPAAAALVPAVARPTDLLAEIAASRPRPPKSPTASPPGIATPPAAVSAAIATPVRLEERESIKPVAASVPAAPLAPAVVTTPPPIAPKIPIVVLSAPPAALKAPAVVHSPPPVAPKAPAVVPSSPVVVAKAPTVAPPPPKAAPVEEMGNARGGAQAPNPPAQPSPVRPATIQKPARPIDPPAKPHGLPAAVRAPAAHAPLAAAKPVPQLDRTQTVRALTSLELGEGDSSRLFAIQLAVAERDFRPEEIPNLGIFEEYRLYSTTGLDGDKVLHALRLGFFTDEGAAEAVAGYLRSHFEHAALKRVSAAERDRFVEQRVKARKDAGATGIHAAIELSSPDLKTTTSLADLTQRTSRRRSDEPRR